MLTRLSKRVLTATHSYSQFSSVNTPASSSDVVKEYVYDNRMFNHFQKNPETNVYTILLNQNFDLSTLEGFLKMSEFFIATDGAANRLYLRTHKLGKCTLISLKLSKFIES